MPHEHPAHSVAPDHLPDQTVPLVRLLMLIGFIIAGTCVGLFVVAILMPVLWNIPITDLPRFTAKPTTYPHGRDVMLALQAVPHALSFTVAPLLMLYATLPRRAWREWAGRQKQISGTNVLAGIALTLVSVPLMSWVIEWNANLHLPPALADLDHWMRAREDELREVTRLLAQMKSPVDLLTGILGLALIPAIGEELVFRGIMQPTLARWFGDRPGWGIWVTAIIFSAIHTQFLGFFPRMLLGAGFGYLYVWSGRLAAPIAAHFANNALQVVLLYLQQRGAAAIDPDSTAALPLPWVLGSVVLTVWAVVLIRRRLRHPLPLLDHPLHR